ncbi:DUF2231 domain-containing protein [Aquihabitans daechungensis]|uniref:DUF2231 domain-containing protein n=1 Tax=Aquihabitans daechungensis TaxID=1052257 RepID=UPI003B9E2D8F
MQTFTLERIGRAVDQAEVLDRVADPIHQRLDPLLDPSAVGAVLRGEWLGHPVHPLLTDIPIGCWTTAWILDVFGGSDQEGWAEAFVALGVVAAVPTAWAGWADWLRLSPEGRRTGVVHAAANSVAVGLYAASWRARRKGDVRRGKRLGHAGATVATVGAYFGGHLAFGSPR